MTDYTSVKIPKRLVERFNLTDESKLYRNFSEFVMESVRTRLNQMTVEVET